MSILNRICIALIVAVASLTASYYACLCCLTTQASYMRIAAKSSMLIFFAAFGILHVYLCLQAMASGQARRQIVACGWIIASAIGLAVVKIYFVL